MPLHVLAPMIKHSWQQIPDCMYSFAASILKPSSTSPASDPSQQISKEGFNTLSITSVHVPAHCYVCPRYFLAAAKKQLIFFDPAACFCSLAAAAAALPSSAFLRAASLGSTTCNDGSSNSSRNGTTLHALLVCILVCRRQSLGWRRTATVSRSPQTSHQHCRARCRRDVGGSAWFILQLGQRRQVVLSPAMTAVWP